jgi:hypothetical protein
MQNLIIKKGAKMIKRLTVTLILGFMSLSQAENCPLPDKAVQFNSDKITVKDVIKTIFETSQVKYTITKAAAFDKTILLKVQSSTCKIFDFIFEEANLKYSGKNPIKIEANTP